MNKSILELANKYPELQQILDTICIVDIGNAFTKTNEEYCIPSTVIEVDRFVDSSDNSSSHVEWCGKKYVVGSVKGHLETSDDKYMTDHYKLCLLTAIVLNFGGKHDITTRLGLGLPVKHYDDHHEALREEMMKFAKDTHKLVVDGEDYVIDIIDVQVFKQGGTLSSDNIKEFEYPLMIIDFGGVTLDVSYWEHSKNKKGKYELKMTDSRSFTELGFEEIMKDFTRKVNALPGSNNKTTIHDAIRYLETNKIKFADVETLQNLRDDVFGGYVKSAFTRINTDIGFATCEEVKLMGGPAKELLSYMKELISTVCDCNTELINEEIPQIMNAKLFYNRYTELIVAHFLKEVATKVEDTKKEVAITTATTEA